MSQSFQIFFAAGRPSNRKRSRLFLHFTFDGGPANSSKKSTEPPVLPASDRFQWRFVSVHSSSHVVILRSSTSGSGEFTRRLTSTQNEPSSLLLGNFIF